MEVNKTVHKPGVVKESVSVKDPVGTLLPYGVRVPSGVLGL